LRGFLGMARHAGDDGRNPKLDAVAIVKEPID
jgi:hypothetical protein